MTPAPYDGMVAAAPVTVPYVRYSQETAHWWIARALKAALDAAGLGPADIDGFSVSSFSLAPDTPVGLTQHLGLTLNWLDTIPMGGMSGIAALRLGVSSSQAPIFWSRSIDAARVSLACRRQLGTGRMRLTRIRA